jgi:hypothetical protein
MNPSMIWDPPAEFGGAMAEASVIEAGWTAS